MVDNSKIIDASKSSGSICYSDEAKIFQPARNLPNESEAIKSASDFLQKIGMLPEDSYILQVVSDEMGTIGKNNGELEHEEINTA